MTTRTGTPTSPTLSSDPLLQPFTLGNVTFRNRVMSTSHASRLTRDDFPQEVYQRYHEEKAKGGIALTMFGGSSNVSLDSPNTFQQIDVSTDRVVPHLREFSGRIHSHGTALMIQLTHLGRRGDAYTEPWLPMIGPSAVRETLHRATPRSMEEADIKRVVRDFGLAAKRARLGGLDGLETSASGHLLGQFMDPTVNLRTDKYGGSTTNRCRFVIEVHEEIRKQVGDDFVTGIRLALEDGCSYEESLEMARILQRTGLFDFFNVSYGRIDTKMALAVNSMPAMFMPSAPWLAKAAAFKRAVDLPVFHAAKIADLATARHAIREGLVDMIGMTRAHIAEPHLVRLVEQGREDQARPCVGASFCRNHKSTCIHNPATSRETFLEHEIAKADQTKRVLVIGAGPAGLEAARVAALRGHHVTVLEANSSAGGQVLLAASGKWRRDLIGIVDWRVAELARLNVEVRYNCYAEVTDVLAFAADVVIVATGGLPNLDTLPGGELCKSVFDAMTDTPPRQGTALIYDGTGRHNAYLCAERYVGAGVNVTLAVLDSLPAQDTGGRGDDIAWMRNIATWNVPVRADLELIKVGTADNGRRQATFRHQLTNELVRIEADHIVAERGMLPIDDLFESARMYSANDGQTDIEAFATAQPQPVFAQEGDKQFHLYRIGDASASRDIHTAIYDAYRLCQKL
jgi:2,4-dienoyl-CoA reductase-like NADH-dependent reductase (Old Yellow Enzyme family)